MGKTRRQVAREKAVIGIYQHLVVDASLEEIEAYTLTSKTLSNDEPSFQFCKDLIEATLLHMDQYREEISKHLKKGWKINRLSYMEQAILLVAACEILEFDIDKRIVINEAVLIAKEYCDEDSYKFINGVLHSLI